MKLCLILMLWTKFFLKLVSQLLELLKGTVLFIKYTLK